MKKRIGILLAAAMIASMLCGLGAAAAGEKPTVPGIYDLSVQSGYTVTVQTAAGVTVNPTGASINGTEVQFYAEAVKFQISYRAENNTDLHLIMVLKGESAVPTADNMVYISQTRAVGDSHSVSFVVYPGTVDKGTYHVYISQTGRAGLEEIASFNGYQTYTLGDVDGNELINLNDALKILQYSAGLIDLTPAEQLAADVNCDKIINSEDALLVLQYAVELITAFE